MGEIKYLNLNVIEQLNKIAIKLFKQKKGDSHEFVSASKILKVMKECEDIEGDIYDKAIVLFKGIVKSHSFASGNRRTAILALLVFCELNKHKVYIPNNPSNSRVLIGIREDYYSNEEIKNWIKNGKIKEFKRS